MIVSTLVLSALYSVWVSVQLAETSLHTREVASPTVSASLTVLNGLNQTQSALKSWLLLHQDEYRNTRRESWTQDVIPALGQMTDLSSRWRRPQDREMFRLIHTDIAEVQKLQESLERMDKTHAQEANARLADSLSPLAAKVRDKLETLVQVENKLMDDDLSFQASLIQRLNLLQAILIVFGAVAGLVTAYLLIRGITLPIQKAIGLADEIAAGNYDRQAAISGSEEINRLGFALERMRTTLREKTWLNQAQISFNERIRAVSTQRELAEAATAALAECMPVLVGALYSSEGDFLKPMGGYALPKNKASDEGFRIGEGIAGQAASERKILAAPGLEHGLRLESASGNVVPQEIVAAPMSYKNELVGVVELSFAEKLKDHERSFVQIAAEAGAVVLSSVRQGEKIKNLLQETQAQAEELQVQQEELKTANDELQTRQEELQSTNEELETQKQTLDVKNAELEQAQRAVNERAEELDRVSKYKSEFLANMSHELRTPLNSQLVLAKLLSDNKDGNLTEKQIEFARTILATGQDLLKLINDILDLSKVEAGKLDLDVRDTRVKEITGDLQRDFEHIAAEKGLELRVEVEPGMPETIRTDSHRLCQILRNLLSNAFKFTAAGSVTLRAFRVSDLPKSHPLAASAPVAFSVSDTGIGIAEDHQQKVFQAFEQVDSSIGRKYGGTGLGLAISANLATLLGGKISVKSQPGEGSTFTLLLPSELEAKESPKEPTPSRLVKATEQVINRKAPGKNASLPGQGNRILIVEDDANFARVLSELAEEEGFKPLAARDGPEGLEYAHLFRPDCILLDYRLPGLDGLRILKELKNNPSTRHIPIYMISIDDQGLEAQKLGAIGYLLKPASPEQIRQALQRLKSLAHGHLRHVLVIDDDPVQREHIIQTIGNGKVKSVGVSTAEAARAALKGDTTFDCMVLDLGLPDRSGFDFLREMHSDKSITVPPVIIYTARDLRREEEEKLRKYSETIIIKGAHSSERLLDEVSLFTHRAVEDLPEDHRKAVEDLYRLDSAFQGKEILLVDDEIRNIFALSSALEGTGLKVSVARNGQEALDSLDSLPKVDLVLMDIMMPVLDGYEATRRIRSSEKHRNIPVIALTAKAMKEDRRLCLEAGASDYLAKPIDLERLFSLLRVWLSK